MYIFCCSKMADLCFNRFYLIYIKASSMFTRPNPFPFIKHVLPVSFSQVLRMLLASCVLVFFFAMPSDV